MRLGFIVFGLLAALAAVGAFQLGDARAFLISLGIALGAFFIASKIKVTRYRRGQVRVGPERKVEHF